VNVVRRMMTWFYRRSEDRTIGCCLLCGGRRGGQPVMQQSGADVWVHLECPGTQEL
jgi:hypothetical protein